MSNKLFKLRASPLKGKGRYCLAMQQKVCNIDHMNRPLSKVRGSFVTRKGFQERLEQQEEVLFIHYPEINPK